MIVESHYEVDVGSVIDRKISSKASVIEDLRLRLNNQLVKLII